MLIIYSEPLRRRKRGPRFCARNRGAGRLQRPFFARRRAAPASGPGKAI